MKKQKEIFEKHSKYFGYGHLDKPEKIIPPVGIVFYSFHIMVGVGSFFMLFFLIMYFKMLKNKITENKLFLKVMYITLWLSYLGIITGWTMAEVGRQPWTVFGVLPTSKSATPIHLTNVKATFFIFLTLFVILGFAELKMMLKQIKDGPDSH
jgi:cytochrome d ubiquinol oxidase subunit I